MPLIALTGGIASGKSTISARLAELGAVIIDADAIVREVQAPGSPVLAEIAEAFGTEMLTDAGALDREALGARVFGDDAALRTLNAIVHPAVRAESNRRIAAAFDRDPDAVVIYDVPLLAETRADDPWELIVVADAPAEMRRERLVVHRGMDAEHAQARIDAQVSDAARRAIANVVIDTSGTMAHTLAQTDALWERLRAR